MTSVQNDNLMADSRTWLLPHNRRIRHLKGLCFRNLTLLSPARSQDDTVLLRPKGALLLPEKGLFPSKSISNLNDPQPERFPLTSVHQNVATSDHEDGGPSMVDASTANVRSPLRRRTTLDWSFAGTNARQRRFEADAERRLFDAFFSLHVDGIEEPVYVSEIAKQTTNPNFIVFDLSAWGPAVTRQDSVIIRLWIRRQFGDKFKFLVEKRIHLPSLQYVGKVDSLGRLPSLWQMAENDVVVELSDGIYTISPFPSPRLPNQTPKTRSHSKQPSRVVEPSRTCTYDQLFQMQVLDQCIHDDAHTRRELAQQIAASIPPVTQAALDEASHQLREIEEDLESQRSRIEFLQKKKLKMETAIAERRRVLRGARESIEEGRRELESDASRESIEALRALVKDTALAVRQHRRRIVLDLLRIFPIEPLPDSPFSFSIRGIHLPDSSDIFDPTTSKGKRADRKKFERYAAALGFVAQVVAALETYFDIALPYSLVVRGSASLMLDRISLLPPEQSTFRLVNSTPITAPFVSSPDSASPAPGFATQPTAGSSSRFLSSSSASSSSQPLLLSFSPSPPLFHPLNPASTPRFRAEYAVFLLNKDIQVLANILGLRLVDIKQTLPNLKYVLYVASAGEGEVPERVRGSIKALGLVGSS